MKYIIDSRFPFFSGGTKNSLQRFYDLVYNSALNAYFTPNSN